MNGEISRWTQVARAGAESVARQAEKRVRRGLLTTASALDQATIVTDKLAAVGAEFGAVMVRRSRELAACNLSLSRELLLAARKRLERAARAETLADAWRDQTRSWPATRARLTANLRSYRNTLAKTYTELKRTAIGASADSRVRKSQASPKRRQRSVRKSRAAA
jgi:hypothetical protein